MSSTPSCCAALFNQRQQQAAHHVQYCKGQPCLQSEQSKLQPQNCTVVEGGRVVVKPCPQPKAEVDEA